ncbi:hypothetical protein TNCT_693601 [Trichonephila clavata]|uniref:Uncharacterized protein n=1 Tax=Trichonephila clavata TaxID=2740835 RepID=A0A8X6HXR9_TRICU|nr:hypothetical protein TNCT_693601 [Trichonephila clavata]
MKQEFDSILPLSERPLKVVIKVLLASTDINDIKTDLTNQDNSIQLGLEELRAINSISWICVQCSRKAVTLLAAEFKEQIKALGAKSEIKPSVESTPVESKNEAIAPEEISDIEIDDCEDIVEDPPSVIADHTPMAPVAEPATNIINDSQPVTSSSNVDQAQIKPKRIPPIVIDEQYNTP